ncbi:DUF5953 family protein [Archangium violaceum]|uniref:Uncharacterized protein n=1 Tax=Archangium violaceum Cb vi76 TaxID=1406225 RepID=A0A084SLG7_9BACT|nr:DUF5953 family protein [Archangium violaceum]KFA89302.1 hypothetical protein Q664_35785 [Archangium violaceum Cb vi76]
MWGAHLQFTEAPLDVDNPTHLDALLRAYERFLEIGGRSPPCGSARLTGFAGRPDALHSRGRRQGGPLKPLRTRPGRLRNSSAAVQGG